MGIGFPLDELSALGSCGKKGLLRGDRDQQQGKWEARVVVQEDITRL